MKKFLVCILLLTTLFPLASCGRNYKSKTAEFYGELNKECFYFTGDVTKGNAKYVYTQAVDEDSVTTIEDHENDAEDGYVIYDGTYLHQLDLKKKKYNTLKTTNGVYFLFDVKSYKNFNTPKTIRENVVFQDETCYCETFVTNDDNGNETGENNYYFKDDRLYGIEWVQEGKITGVIVIKDYSNSIPEDIYTSIPQGFTAGIYSAEEIIDPSDFWED